LARHHPIWVRQRDRAGSINHTDLALRQTKVGSREIVRQLTHVARADDDSRDRWLASR
jgi:hypothetical protein